MERIWTTAIKKTNPAASHSTAAWFNKRIKLWHERLTNGTTREVHQLFICRRHEVSLWLVSEELYAHHLNSTTYFTVPSSCNYSFSSTVILHACTLSIDNSLWDTVSSSHYIALVIDTIFISNISRSHYIALVIDTIFISNISSSHYIALVIDTIFISNNSSSHYIALVIDTIFISNISSSPY